MTSSTVDAARTDTVSSIYSRQGSSKRLHGRITKEDIRSAGLRRWNGRSRITTDWLNLYQVCEDRTSACFGRMLTSTRNQNYASNQATYSSTLDSQASRAEAHRFVSTHESSKSAASIRCLTAA